jgi:hypothetical protein
MVLFDHACSGVSTSCTLCSTFKYLVTCAWPAYNQQGRDAIRSPVRMPFPKKFTLLVLLNAIGPRGFRCVLH